MAFIIQTCTKSNFPLPAVSTSWPAKVTTLYLVLPCRPMRVACSKSLATRVSLKAK